MGLLDKAGGSSGKTEAKPKAKAKPAARRNLLLRLLQ